MPIRSLRALTAVFLAIFLGATLATAAGVFIATARTTDRLVDQRIADVSSLISPDGAAPDLKAIEMRIETARHDRETADLGLILLRDHHWIAGNVTVSRRLRPGFGPVDVNDKIAGLTHGRALARDLGDGLRLIVIGETEPVDHYRDARTRIYLLGFGSIILIVVTGTILFGRVIHRRIVEMRHTVEAIIEGDLSRRVPVDGSGSEFARQAEAFNRMLTRICDLMDEIRNVSSGVAHELRTPLARLRGELDLIAADHPDSPLRPRIEGAIGEADKLLGMFAALLRISEIESGSQRRNFQPLDLVEIVRDCAEMLEPVLQEHGQRLEVDLPLVLPLRGDRQLLANLIVNLVENAIRHTPDGTTIRIMLRSQEKAVRVVVADNGPGISVADRELALRRFGRLDGAGPGGTGLGLAIVQSIAHLHGGDVELGDARPGLSVAVMLALS